MSLSVTRSVNLRHNTLKSVVLDDEADDGLFVYDTTLGGIFHENAFSWLSHGPRLEVFDVRKGDKVGAWTFGYVLKDINTEIICVEEIQRPNGRLPLLAVGLNSNYSGIVCIFDFARSKVIRAININEKISSLHVIDDGCDIFTLPGPLRNFDGVLAVGTAGGAVYLIDICRQICEEALTIAGLNEVRDELNPCQLFNITVKDIPRIELQKELALRNSQHLSIHLNAVFDGTLKHFVLKGPKGEDRIYVNKEEVTVSALCYCSQLGSLLVGFNFGAFQLFDLMKLNIVYSSPVCDGNIPIVNFVVQEPADDPRVYCYIWAIYSSQEVQPTCLPLAAMYTFSYHSKEYHEGYGFLYQDFNAASIHFQMKLGVPNNFKSTRNIVGGYCINVDSIGKGPIAREGYHHPSNEDNLSLCLIAWTVCYSNDETDTFLSVFDLNQWYKEQMPNAVHLQLSANYMVQIKLNDLIASVTDKSDAILNFASDKNSFMIFKRAQRLEEHFCPNSISFRMCCIRENDCVFLRNYGVQKALLAQIQSTGPLCLVEPAETYQEIVAVGLVPLFIDLPANAPVSTSQQREVILGAALENLLIGWLCNCASEWSNGSFLSTGCSLNVLTTWIFQRASILKMNCDNFCQSLFDHSGVRLDNNISSLLTCCTRQLNYLCSLFNFITGKLGEYVSNLDLLIEQYQALQRIVHYFEVLKWFLNVGLLPECPLTSYPRTDDHDRVNAPYPAEALTNFYNQRRGLLGILNKEQFKSSKSVLFIDQLIERGSSSNELQVQWCNDGGNGLYPPPSLQALLRTYLTRDMDLACKHAIVTYLFLDLVTTLNQEEYKTIATYLLKFPIVFKISMSLIKIIQGFWQLDHGDFNTAMGLLLDSAIHKKDLSLWHHKVVLRALTLEKQYNFALLYIKIKQPAFIDDEDILAVISLYVTNNMVDEAFYYERHFSGREREEKFLNHLFNECSKNDKLKPIIYRSLTSKEEDFFLRYLMNCKSPKTQDLHVYYHILRGHYIEAFESHELTIPTQMDNLGLHGKQVSSTRERIMSMLSEIMPELTRNLINLCRKEKTNVWKKVTRPTPMSVIVQNNQTNMYYKSTLIGAALTTAKQTFNNTTINDSKIETESTPFLRTPKVQRDLKNTSTVIIPRVLPLGEQLIENSPCSKRFKMSLGDGGASLSVPIGTNLETPIVKRKISRRSVDDINQTPARTPHSILKVKSLQSHSSTQNEFDDNFEIFENIPLTPISSRKSVLNLSPRKPLGKSPSVRFEGLQSPSSSSVEISPISSTYSPQDSSQPKEKESSDEMFYSPPNSPEPKEKDIVQVELKQETNELEATGNSSLENQEIVQSSSSPRILSTPRARKSYRSSPTSIRSSPRLSALKESTFSSSLLEQDNSEPVSVLSQDTSISLPSETNMFVEDQPIITNETSKLSSILPKLRPRKSLCRKVLESNTFTKDLGSPQPSPSARRSQQNERGRRSQQNECGTISEEKEIVSTVVKYEDGDERHHASVLRRHTFTTSIIESDLDSSAEDSLIRSINSEILGKNLTTSYNTSTYESESDSIYDLPLGKNNILNLSDGMYAFIHSPQRENIDEQMDVDQVNSEENEEELNLKKDDFVKVEIKEDDDNKKYGEIVALSVNSTDKIPEEPERLRENAYREENNLDEFKEKDEENITVREEPSEASEQTLKEDENEIEVKREQTEPLEVVKLGEQSDYSLKEKVVEVDQKFDEYTNSQDSNRSSINRAVDPEMNIFEVSDDLSVNDGFLIENDVMLVEDDLFYDQQNTLESVLEEDIVVASTLQRNVLNDDSSGSKVSHKTEQNEGTVITIGSSSDDEEKESSGEELHSDEELDISYERHITDTDISESASSGDIINEQLNFGLCESDGISIGSEKSRSVSDLSEHNEKTSDSSSMDLDSRDHKEPKLFDSFSTISQCDEVEPPELDETKIEHSKKVRKSEGLFHGYILSTEITNDNSDEKVAIESCNVPLTEQESLQHGHREPQIFEECIFDNTVEVSTTIGSKSDDEETKSLQSAYFSHNKIGVSKVEKDDENGLKEIRKIESELDQPISTETDEINQDVQLDSNVNDVSEIMDKSVYVPVVHDSINERDLKGISNNENNLETTNQLMSEQNTLTSSFKSTVTPILDKKSESSTKEIQLKQEGDSSVKEETSQRTIVTRRQSRSSTNSEQASEDIVLRKSPSRRKSLTNDCQSQEISKTARTRRSSLEETLTPKRQTRSSSVETVKKPISKSESRNSSRAASVPPSLDMVTDAEETLTETSIKSKSTKLSSIEEEPSSSSVLTHNIIEDFSSGRRVTRRQMNILQKTITGIVADESIDQDTSNEEIFIKTVAKRRTRSTSVHISDSEDRQPQKNIKSEVKRSSRASSVPPLLSISEEEFVETPSKKSKNPKKESLRKQDKYSSSNNQDGELDELDKHQNATGSSILPQKPSRRLRSNSQSSDVSERPKSTASALSRIAEEQVLTATLSTIDNGSTTRRITRKQKDMLNRTLDEDQDGKNTGESSTTGGLIKPSRRLRSGSQTSEVDLSDTKLARKTRASSVPPQMITEGEANKNQVKPELSIVLKRISSESEISKIPDSSPKQAAKRILRRRSSQNVETSQADQKNTVDVSKLRTRTKSAAPVISEASTLDTSKVETKKGKRDLSLVKGDGASASVPSKRTRKNSIQK